MIWGLCEDWVGAPVRPKTTAPIVRPMTLLCIVMTDDSVLISADSKATFYEHPNFWQPFPATVEGEKFRPTGVPSVMWGFSGMHVVVDPVLKWADTASWDSRKQLGESAQERCAEATKRAKRITRARGGSGDDPRLLFSVLFAGYINGQQSAMLVDELGFASPYPSDADKYEPMPFGGGRTVAAAGWNVLTTYHPETKVRSASELRVFMDAVCAAAAGLNPPVDVWEITSQGTTKIERET